MILAASVFDPLAKMTQAAQYAIQHNQPITAPALPTTPPVPPPPPSGMTPAQRIEHDRLRAIWIAETDPTRKAAARAALVAYDASLPPPPPPPAPAPIRAPVSDFFVAHQTALLVGGGLLAAAAVGLAIYKSRH